MPLNVQGGKKKPLKAAKKGPVEMTEEEKAFKKEMAEKKKYASNSPPHLIRGTSEDIVAEEEAKQKLLKAKKK
ncbi:hypothetical protein AK88_05478 [Plasmodium fragile]|uniref:Translation machinery-associated protein 7 n=1 Tax=Plasmodium fragile TaxID=5857 RepID=A0A0D9QGP5_PLAFR|nr:uncharacterized protein AK88_05478 [Plasmodium fragile]KJP84896.1 hypothetical protein AK88_05478 [Plasmodium fragile]